MNSSERRSSSRSIKRKRFDDEIVDYALPPPTNRGLRQRTPSQSLAIAPGSNENSTTSPPQHILLSQPSTSTAIPAVQTPTTLVVVTKAASPATITSTPVSIKPPVATIKIEPDQIITETVTYSSSPASTSTPTMTTSPFPTSTIFASQQHKQPIQPLLPIKTEPIFHPTTPVQINREAMPASAGLPFALSKSMFAEQKLKTLSLKNAKKNRKNRGLNQLSTKDLGRWKPVDDLALIIGVQQTNDLKLVHRGTKFSCKFTLQELQNRWYALLYEESVSRIAVAAMRNLHPELVENIQSKALYTTQEEDLLATIKSTENPTLETFQNLLRKNSSIFYSARTPKALQNHWQLMKQYYLLPDQVIKVPGRDGTVLSFSDNEELLNDAELAEAKDEVLDTELELTDRRHKREIRNLESELGRWNVLVDSMTGLGFPPEFDRQTLAVLRGRLVRYLMRSREITIGRSTKDSTVDVDLSLEGPAFKVSRKQGTIKLRSNADFFLTNEGQRAIYVDGMALLTGSKTRLSHNCVIEIAGLRFTFLVNFDLINAIQQESAKMNVPLT